MQILLAMPVGLTNTDSRLLAGVIIFFASAFPWIVAVSSMIFLAVRPIAETTVIAPFRRLAHRTRDMGYIAVITALTHEFTIALKNFYTIDRPIAFTFDLVALITKTDYGFPSGHAAVFSALAVGLLFIHKKAGMYASIAALIIGAARIASGVHTPLDVLGGYILGITIACVGWFIVDHLDTHHERGIKQ
jgi:membrane-associated phospholipid phosphatase